jgi:type III secretion protein W
MNVLPDTLSLPAATAQVAGPSAAGSGIWQGTPVSVSQAPSALGDAAEEVSLHLAHRVESRVHADRRLQAIRRPVVLSTDQVHSYLEKVGRIDMLNGLVSGTEKLLGSPDKAALRETLDRLTSGDPTLRYLLLQHARSSGLARGATPDVLSRLDEAIADLNDQSGETIQAHLTSAEHAARHASHPEEIRRFQGTVQALLGQPTLALALQEVIGLAKESETGLQSAVDNLMRALGACLPLLGPAREKALLQTLITDLYHLKSLKTVFVECRLLVSWLKLHLLTTASRQEDADAPCG